MFTISADQLRGAVPRCPKPDAWAPALNHAMGHYGVADDVDYMVEFLAQCAHESAEFTRLQENLNYSPARLMQVWPKRFPTLDIAARYGNNPRALAERVYGGRIGNRPEGSGDGYLYRGRGIIMVTGKSNYTMLARKMGDASLVSSPDRLCNMETAAMAAAAWWSADARLNQLADDLPNDDDAADLVSITRIVNGGTVGLAHRQQLRTAFSRALR